LSLVDDLSAETIRQMTESGFQPALIVETSPQNFQVWLNHGRTLDHNMSTWAANSWDASIANKLWHASRADIELLKTSPWEKANRALEEVIKETVAQNASAFVIDITTMPRVCFFPVVQTALDDQRIRTLIIVYTEPEAYNLGTLSSEPAGVTIVPPFDRLPPPGRDPLKIGWISLKTRMPFST
jgi:hypothetical protein